MTYRFYLTVTPFHATVACDSRSPPSSVRSALTLSPARPRRSPLADPARCGAPPSPATTHYPPPVTHCLFVCPLFSHTYKSLGGQPLYFHIHTKPPGVYPLWASVLRPPCPLCCALSSTLLSSSGCSLFLSLCPLFCILFFVFNQLQPLFQNTRGVGIPDGSAGWRSTQLRTTYNPLPTFFCLSNRLHGRNKFGDINADSGQFGRRVEFRWEFFVGYLFQPH